jgi:indole-3-acetate monooxygenase
MGGLEHSLPDVLRIEEALAWTDGSAAWVVTLCSGAGWFVGFLDSSVVEEIVSNPRACIAGSGASTGTASIAGDGYIINGEWKYASGAVYATMLTANCVITKDGHPIVNDDGTPLIRAFIFRKSEVELEKSWSSMGMVATGSHTFKIQNLYVPSTRSFEIDARNARITLPVYQYPFLQLAETTLAVNFSGLAQQFIDLCEEIFRRRSHAGKTAAWHHHAGAVHTLLQARTDFYNAVDASWSYCSGMAPIPDVVLEKVSDTSRALYRTSLTLVSNLYPFAGMAAADPRTEVNRVWRNLFTASQHTLFSQG